MLCQSNMGQEITVLNSNEETNPLQEISAPSPNYLSVTTHESVEFELLDCTHNFVMQGPNFCAKLLFYIKAISLERSRKGLLVTARHIYDFCCSIC